ncbi:MAG TPA: hypothetical protein VEN31_08605 [Candidatus Bathyarchaeia archaeon]|nr:hypothetical protein [Candidatus Bathyarchaeia archaeon]
MNEARAMATLALFAVGILGGVVAHTFLDRGPAENPYPALPKVDEPRAAHDVVAAVGSDDAQALSRMLDSTMLTDLDTALQPIVDVRTTKFVGAVESEGRLLSAYVVTGKTTEGIDFVVGFVLRVSNDQVVGVN